MIEVSGLESVVNLYMMLPDPMRKQVLTALAACLITFLFLTRSIFLFIPVFAIILLLLWKKGGGDVSAWEDDDPADWWKKGKQFGEH